jgi:hypothetical protein
MSNICFAEGTKASDVWYDVLCDVYAMYQTCDVFCDVWYDV